MVSWLGGDHCASLPLGVLAPPSCRLPFSSYSSLCDDWCSPSGCAAYSHFNLLFVNIGGVLLHLTLNVRGLKLLLPELLRLVTFLLVLLFVVHECLLVLVHLADLLTHLALLVQVTDSFFLLFHTSPVSSTLL